jgi:Zn-dependent protease with chaperone function
MVFLILIYLVLVALPLPWPAPFVGGLGASLAATAFLTAIPVAVAIVSAHRTRRQLIASPYRRDDILANYSVGRTRHSLLMMATHALAVGVFGWGWAVRQLCGAERTSDLPFGAELLVMAPFIVAMLLSWAAYYTAERTAAQVSTIGIDEAEPYGGRWSYVVFLARQHLAMISAPLGLFLIQQGSVRQFPHWFEGVWYPLALMGLLFVAIIIAPWILRVLMRTERLPSGPLRDRLEAAAARLGLRYSDILLWNTQGGVANAMVAGPVPWVRYVFLSDRLVDSLPPDEIEAVFGHEVGHVRHGHFLYYILFILLSLVALAGLWIMGLSLAFGPLASGNEPWEFEWLAVPQVAMVGAYMFVAFGFLSRRCERQADLFGCRAVSCCEWSCSGHSPAALAPAGRGLCPTGIRTFIRALDRVAAVNGISRGKPGWLQSWLHSTIARRVAFLEQVIADPSNAVRFQRRVTLIKWVLIVALAAVFVILGSAGFWNEMMGQLLLNG